MGLLRPTKLIMEGFRSFKERTEINFPESGSVLINGHYKGNSISSGSGKSSVLIAMSLALGYCDIPVTKLKNWDSKSLYVSLTLTDGTNIYEIIIDPSLRLIENGIEQKGTSTAAKERLNDIIKTSSDLTKALTYRPQRTAGKFLTLTDSGIKDFLSGLLGLNEIEEAHSKLKEELKGLDSEIEIKTRTIENLKVNLTNAKNAHSSSVPLVTLEANLTRAQLDDSNAQSRLDLLVNNSEAESNLKDKLNQALAERQRILYAESVVMKCKNQNISLRGSIERLTEEIKSIQLNLCPTCQREWNQGQLLLETKTKTINEAIEQMKVNLQSIRASEPLIDPIHKQEIENKINEINVAMGSLNAPLQDAQSAKRSSSMALNQAYAALNSYKTSEKEIKRQEMSIAEMEEKSEENIRNRAILFHAESLLSKSGFLGVIFDEVLLEITKKTNDMMSFVPNVNTFTLSASSVSVTQKGKVNQKIELSMNKDGKKTYYGVMSGGQKTSAELCSDLAVRETILSRSGSNLGWVALDEAMDGLDPETKMEALDIIKSNVKGLVIVVDHSTEIKEGFDQVIEIEYDGKESRVVFE